MESGFSLHPLGDNAVIILLGEEINAEIQQKIHLISSYLNQHPKEWMIEYIPAFTTVAVFYNPLKVPLPAGIQLLPYDYVCAQLREMLVDIKAEETGKQRVVEIPVFYGDEFGPDLSFVAEHNKLTINEVIHLHTSGEYLVHMIGFAPGFPYIGGMSDKIAAPRRQTPRLKIPARSVGIAGKQTGIYPIETPGGWQIIGRTPLNLFRPNEQVPSLLTAGDRIKFTQITYEEYLFLEEKNQ